MQRPVILAMQVELRPQRGGKADGFVVLQWLSWEQVTGVLADHAKNSPFLLKAMYKKSIESFKQESDVIRFLLSEDYSGRCQVMTRTGCSIMMNKMKPNYIHAPET